MVYTFVVSFAVAVSLMTTLIHFSEKCIVERVILGIICFFMSHIFVSFILFAFDSYSTDRTAVGTLLLNTVVMMVSIIIYLKNDQNKKEKTSISYVLIPVLICAVVLPFSLQKNEFFGMGQDEGVYQTQAIGFIYGYDHVYQKIEEYDLLTDEQQRQEYLEDYICNKLIGNDTPKSISGIEFASGGKIFAEDAPVNEGYMHGIPCFSALLAMSGRLFGLKHMADINTVFMICIIFIVFFICRRLELKNTSCIIAGLSTGLSPQIIWNAKSSLTETFITLLFLVMIYFLLYERKQHYAVIPIICFSCYHMTYYTMLPLFLVVFFLLYAITKQKMYAVIDIVLICLYPVSAVLIYHIQPVYTIKNYSPVWGIITESNFHKIVVSASVLMLMLFCIALLIMKKAAFWVENVISRIRKLYYEPMFIRICSITLLSVMIIRSFIVHEDNVTHNVTSATFKGYWLNTGFLVMPSAYIYTAIFPARFKKNINALILSVFFIYCVIIYGLILLPEIRYFFYYGRYIGPFIPISVIFSLMLLDTLDFRVNISLAMVGSLLLVPTNVVLMKEKDDTMCKYDALTQIMQSIKSDDTVYVLDSNMNQFVLPLPIKYITGATVISETKSISLEVAESLKDGRTIVISGTELPDNSLKLIDLCRYERSYWFDTGVANRDFIPFPTSYYKQNEEIYIYEKVN